MGGPCSKPDTPKQETVGIACLNGHDLTKYVECGYCYDNALFKFADLRRERDSLQAKSEKLLAALELECGKRCADGINPCNARLAIAEFKGKS
jgi:hypothetical protein